MMRKKRKGNKKERKKEVDWSKLGIYDCKSKIERRDKKTKQKKSGYESLLFVSIKLPPSAFFPFLDFFLLKIIINGND